MSYNSKYTGAQVEVALDLATTALQEHQDISGLATKQEVSAVENKIPSIEGLASEQWVENKGYITADDIPETTVPDEVAITDGIEPSDDTEVWIDLSEDNTAGGLSDAPNDDKLYGRKNGQWVETRTVFNNIVTSNWVESTTYTDYGYSCDLSCEGVVNTDYAEVTFNITEATSGNYAPVCETDVDIVRIYSKVSTEITIPTIIIR